MILECEQGGDGPVLCRSSAAVPGLVPHSEHPLRSGAASSEEANEGRFIHTYVLRLSRPLSRVRPSVSVCVQLKDRATRTCVRLMASEATHQRR